MHIDALEVKGFGKITDLNIDLTNGLNVVYGPNESGKSTIQSFIKAMFFGLKGGRTTKGGMLAPTKRYTPWQSGHFGGTIKYQLEKGDIFSIYRDFNKNLVFVYNENFNDITSEFSLDNRKNVLVGQQHFGLTETCFERTIFIKQMGTSLSETSNGELASRLLNIQESGSQDTSYKLAESALKTALKEYVGTDKTTTKPLNIIRERLDKLTQRQAHLSEDYEKYLDNIMLLKDEQKELTVLKERLVLYTRLEKWANLNKEISILKNKELIYQELQKDYNETNTLMEQLNVKKEQTNNTIEGLAAYSKIREEDIDKLLNNNREIDRYDADIIMITEKISGLNNRVSALGKELEPLSSDGKSLGEYENEISLLTRTRDDAKSELEDMKIEDLHSKIEPLKTKKNISILLSLALLVAAVLIATLGEGSISIILAGISLITALCLGAVFLKSTQDCKNIMMSLQENSLHCGQINSAIDEINNRLNTIYDRFGVENQIALVRVFSRFENLYKELQSLSEEISSLKHDKDLIILKMTELRDENEKIKKAAGGAPFGEHVSVEALKSKVTQLKEAELRFERLELQEEGLQDKIKGIIVRYRDITGEGLASDITSISGEIEANEYTIAEKDKEVSELDLSIKTDFGDQLECENFGQGDVDSIDINWDEKANEFEILIDNTKVEINSIALSIRELETMAKTYDAEDELQQVEEEMEELEVGEKFLLKTRSALTVALDVLEQSAEEMRDNFAPVLNTMMSSIIKDITLCRYDDLKVDDNLMLKVKAPETGDVVSAPNLSGGTIDQMYLAMRIATAQLIEKEGEKLPLVLDEVFAQYDNNRLKEAYEFLTKLSGERQIVLFTCRFEELELIRNLSEDVNIIELA